MSKNIIEKLIDYTDAQVRELEKLKNLYNDEYEKAINLMLNAKGKIVFIGVGKSGHIGTKLAATISSTGTPSIFVHATEAVHGDLGMIQENDVAILLSNSGETKEVLNTINSLKKMKIPTISISSSENSTLAKNTDIALCYSYEKEADHLDLAPTTSSTIMLVIGDSLACVLSELKGFKKEDFHLYHPGGSLGDKLSK